MSRKNFLVDYLVLFSFLSLALLFFAYFSYDLLIQQIIVLATAYFYIVWGVVHHKLAGNYHPKVLCEYAVLASFGTALLLILLSRL